MVLKESHRKIAEAVLEKAKSRCRGGIDLLGVYGSASTGDLHGRSDLDLLIVLADENEWPAVSEAFILDDEQVGYDIYCTTWRMLEEDAECSGANISKLMDSELLFAGSGEAAARLEALRNRAREILESDERFGKAQEALQRGFTPYALAMTADTMAKKRAYAAYVISQCMDAVMLFNGRWFRKGVKRTFEELEGLILPVSFEENIRSVIRAENGKETDDALTALLGSVMDMLRREEKRPRPSAEQLRGTYEEMYSNWRGKMREAADRGDEYVSFMSMAFMNYMLDGIAENCEIPEYDLMEDFSALDLGKNADILDEVMEKYLQEYGKAGIEPKHYSDADAFLKEYLG
ncbi:MAG: nucleotidyltransferase domain-containing protein [Oscillospiraceae bacterium]|nr:nucleotidyltransferase domain-containing protein [Oscillospiraceae bacterium]